jgi:hypothetical protein
VEQTRAVNWRLIVLSVVAHHWQKAGGFRTVALRVANVYIVTKVVVTVCDFAQTVAHIWMMLEYNISCNQRPRRSAALPGLSFPRIDLSLLASYSHQFNARYD